MIGARVKNERALAALRRLADATHQAVDALGPSTQELGGPCDGGVVHESGDAGAFGSRAVRLDEGHRGRKSHLEANARVVHRGIEVAHLNAHSDALAATNLRGVLVVDSSCELERAVLTLRDNGHEMRERESIGQPCGLNMMPGTK